MLSKVASAGPNRAENQVGWRPLNLPFQYRVQDSKARTPTISAARNNILVEWGVTLWKAAPFALIFGELGCAQGVSRVANLWGAELCLVWWAWSQESCRNAGGEMEVPCVALWLIPKQKGFELGSLNTQKYETVQNLRSSQIWNVWYWHGVKQAPLSGSVSSCIFSS